MQAVGKEITKVFKLIFKTAFWAIVIINDLALFLLMLFVEDDYQFGFAEFTMLFIFFVSLYLIMKKLEEESDEVKKR